MAKLLAIDWDGVEARYVVAETRGGRIALEAAGSVPQPAESNSAGARAQLAAALRAALAGKANRASALVCTDRGQIELAALSLPPAPDAELPDMVRNMAMRLNSAIAEDAALDFVPLGDDPNQPRKATAVALSPTRLEQIQSVLSGAGLSAQAVALRPYATAALFEQAAAERDDACLVVHVLAEEVDLIALVKGKAVFWRTLRQSNASHDPNAARRLAAEVQRTLLVAGPHLDSRAVGAIHLCGGLDEHPALVEALRESVELPLTLVDPLADHQGEPLAVDHPGRFAPLVGMLLCQARGQRQTVDFLNPRKRPAPPRRW